MSDLPRDFRSQAYLLMDVNIDAWHQQFEEVCESPIEVAFGVAFMLCAWQWRGETWVQEPGAAPSNFPDTTEMVVMPQHPLLGYRVDFLISNYPVAEGSSIVIECDGHNFHERTKEQAAHDRQKDRALQAAGYRVLRFTGSEIYRDAFKCAEEARSTLGMMKVEQK